MREPNAFMTVAGQLVKEDAITRLSHNPMAGAPATQYFVHFVDGGYATVSEVEYRIHLNNGRQIRVYEEDAADTLEKLGLEEFVQDWILDLEKDVG